VKPEEIARQKIDQRLEAAGWTIQDFKDLNLGASLGVAIREFPLKSGFADYLLFVDRKAIGVIEAKPFGTTLSGVEHQSEKYLFSLPGDLPCVQKTSPVCVREHRNRNLLQGHEGSRSALKKSLRISQTRDIPGKDLTRKDSKG